MKYKIHYTVNGEEDWFIVSAETIEELQQMAEQGVERRGGTDAWSEKVYE